MEAGWRNARHRSQWRNTLRDYCAALSPMDVAAIDIEAVLSCLRPIWKAKPETASRGRGRIEKVLDYARTRLADGREPGALGGHLAAILPARAKLTRGHHKAMPYAALPGFLVRLQPGRSNTRSLPPPEAAKCSAPGGMKSTSKLAHGPCRRRA
jgi:hypothetical protein